VILSFARAFGKILVHNVLSHDDYLLL
jgi:hypothetical protein